MGWEPWEEGRGSRAPGSNVKEDAVPPWGGRGPKPERGPGAQRGRLQGEDLNSCMRGRTRPFRDQKPGARSPAQLVSVEVQGQQEATPGCGLLNSVESLSSFGGNGRAGSVRNGRARATYPNPGEIDKGSREKERPRRSESKQDLGTCSRMVPAMSQTWKPTESQIQGTNSGSVFSGRRRGRGKEC